MCQKSLYLVFIFSLLSGCISVSSDDDSQITTENGTQVSSETLALNGFWDGQLDQAGTWRLLIYNGMVLGMDESQGYYGVIDYAEASQTVSLTLDVYTFSSSDSTAMQYLASGVAISNELNGLVFTETETFDTLVGDYENVSTNGSFLLTNDGTWSNGSNLGKLTGAWSAGDHSLYITSLGSSASLKGISSADGCTFNGSIGLISKNINLYELLITERKNCTDYNSVDVPGYMTINSEGNLELYLYETDSLFFMTYSSSSTTDTTEETATE